MLEFLSIAHIIVAVLLIIFVLLQDSKGGAMGMFGGGGSQSMFGGSGGGDFLVKVTRVIAIVFGVTCLALTYNTNQKTESKTDRYVAPAQTSVGEPPQTEKTETKKTDNSEKTNK